MNYFEGCTKENVRQRFMALVKQYHPDRGGDGETMRLINAQYQEFQSSGSVYFTNPNNGYDPYSKRRLTATPAGPASGRTDFWTSSDFAKAARKASYDYSRRQANQPGTGRSNYSSWTNVESATFAAAAKTVRRFGTTSSSQAKVNMEMLAMRRLKAILTATGMASYDLEKIVDIYLTDVGNKWTTFTIGLNTVSEYHSKFYAKRIRSSLKVLNETEVKFYRLKIEGGKLHGFQIQY